MTFDIFRNLIKHQDRESKDFLKIIFNNFLIYSLKIDLRVNFSF